MFKRVGWDGMICLYGNPVGCLIITIHWHPWEEMWNLVWECFLLESLLLTHHHRFLVISGEPWSQPEDSIILTWHLAPRTQCDIYTCNGEKRKRNSALAEFYRSCCFHQHWSSLEKDFRKDKQEVYLFLLWGSCLDCEISMGKFRRNLSDC